MFSGSTSCSNSETSDLRLLYVNTAPVDPTDAHQNTTHGISYYNVSLKRFSFPDINTEEQTRRTMVLFASVYSTFTCEVDEMKRGGGLKLKFHPTNGYVAYCRLFLFGVKHLAVRLAMRSYSKLR